MSTLSSSSAARRVSERAAALVAGLVFGLGLGVSGMTRPAKVLGFLDVTGAWDASLLVVLGAAVAVHAVLGRWTRARRAPLFDASFHLPSRPGLDRPLLVGAAVFGVGWGLGGFCPGPALVSAVSGQASALVFVAAMVVGMLVQHAFARRGDAR